MHQETYLILIAFVQDGNSLADDVESRTMLKCHLGGIKTRSIILYRDTNILFLSLLHLYSEAFITFPAPQAMHKGILCKNLHKHGWNYHLI